ncbi:MAG: hypothetical protein ABS84_14930 [Rubrivivax sp. SCN 71-131]|nr:MAG: hypothetical protein ABS84_14930 [Rubrivivax sp. SCN 71-131]
MTIPILPAAPSTLDPANFRARGDLFFPALTAFSVACNAFSTDLETARQDVLGAVSATVWATGSYAVGARVYDPTNGLLYLCTTAHTGTSGQYPSTQPSRWALMSMTAPPLTAHSASTSSGSPYQLVKAQHAELSNSAQGWANLPASPATGDWVWVGFANGRYDNVVKRNGQNIEGVAEDLTVNVRDASLILRFVGAPYGWKVLVK